MRPRLFALFALLLPLVLAGCKIDTINSFNTPPAQVRFANFLPDAKALDVRGGDTAIWTAVPPEVTTGYRDFDPDKWTYTLRVTGASTDLTQSSYVLNGDQNYSLVAYGTTANPTMLMLPDVITGPGSGTYRIRFLHLSPTWGAVDVYITAPGADIAKLSPNPATLLYGSVGVNADYSPGNYQIRVTQQGTKTVLYDSGTLAFGGNKVVNGIIYTRGSGTLVNLALMETTGSAATTIVNGSVARMRAVNLAPDAGDLNLLADGSALISNLVYAKPAAYAELASGSHAFTVEAAAAPGATVAQFAKTLVSATDTTVYIAGSPGTLTATPLDDDNIPSLSGLARLRFVNVTPDATTFDVLLDTTVIASAVTATAPPTYVATGAGTYTITVRNSATTAPIIAQSGFAVGSSTVFTVFVAGTSAVPALVIAQDK
jgi:hypothetical protein